MDRRLLSPGFRQLPLACLSLLAVLLSPGSLRALTLEYGYDGRGNVVSRSLDGEASVFDYDALDRLRGERGPAATQTFALDANGNRLADGRGVYTVTPGSNRTATTPAGAVQLDAAGYTLADARHRYTWNAAGELAAVRAGAAHELAPDTPIATYAYDYRHLRVLKTVAGTTTVFHHDEAGHLVAETTSTGEPLRSYVWLDGAPVAVIEHAALTGGAERTLYLETDALLTPRAATDDTGREVWRWGGDAYGETGPDEDVDGDGTQTVINLRFPGQYHDAETGLHYNWRRYYAPWEGRYLRSDPVGLAGGLNTYVYANNNPLNYLDPTGEYVHIVLGFVIGATAGVTGTLNDPCATDLDLVYNAIIAGIFGGAAAAIPIGGGLVKAMTSGGLAGLAGSAATQGATAIRRGGGAISATQIATQGAIGAISGGVGNLAGLAYGVRAVRSGVAAKKAVELSFGVGTTASMGAATAANAMVPGELGGLRSASECHCQ